MERVVHFDIVVKPACHKLDICSLAAHVSFRFLHYMLDLLLSRKRTFVPIQQLTKPGNVPDDPADA